MGQHVTILTGIPAYVLGLLGPLAVHRGVRVRHVGHPTGHLLQPADPRQGAGDGNGVDGRPKGSWPASSSAKRAMWAMVV